MMVTACDHPGCDPYAYGYGMDSPADGWVVEAVTIDGRTEARAWCPDHTPEEAR